MNATIRINGAEEALTAATVAELLSARGIAQARGLAVAVNGTVVPSRAWREAALEAGDEVEIVRPFGGG
ncbi:MAG TPA: sulfur carrier protein ThiS [Stellaceae bacterium]|nr:sulfur carrier protein ThiS [Stellaceae bacterium]